MNKKFSLIHALAIVSVIVLSYSCTKEENIREKLDMLERMTEKLLDAGEYQYGGHNRKRVRQNWQFILCI